MIFTEQAKSLLKHWEALNGVPNLEAYQDRKGVWTIGYGHTGPEVVKGLRWTPEQCEDTFAKDTIKYERCVAISLAHAPVSLTDNQFSALVIFCYNIGISGFVGSTALHYVQVGRLENVPNEMKRWNKIRDPSGVYIEDDGLKNRRAKEVALWSTP